MEAGDTHLWGYAVRYGLYFGIAWAAVYWRRWRKRRRELAAQGWPSTEGVIVSTKVTPVPKTTYFHATLQYTFFLDEYRTGTYVQEFSRESEADDFARQMKDKRIQIRYMQSNPNKSVLEQSVIEQHVMLAPRLG